MTSKRKKPGPKPIPAEDRRSAAIIVRLTAAEKEAAIAAAGDGRGDLSAWVRGLIQRAIRRG